MKSQDFTEGLLICLNPLWWVLFLLQYSAPPLFGPSAGGAAIARQLYGIKKYFFLASLT